MPKLVKIVAPTKESLSVSIKTIHDNQDIDQEIVANRVMLEISVHPGFLDGECFLKAIYDNGGELQEVQLPVSWRVKKFYSLDPDRVFFGGVKDKDGKVTRSVTIRSTKSNSFVINSVKSSTKAILCTYRQSESGGYTIFLTLQPKAFTGFLHGDVRIETNLPHQPVVLLPFAAFKNSAISRARLSSE